MEEIWKSITGFEGIYQISNCGNVRSVKRSKNLKHNNSHGYFTVDLYLNGIRKKIRVHRLVQKHSFLTQITNPKSIMRME
jgi:hypothetical protein